MEIGDRAVRCERVLLESESGKLPVLMLLPAKEADKRRPVVVGLSQAGKAEFLKARAETISQLLEADIAVCLPDLTNTGELSDGDRGQYSGSADHAATALMLGKPLVARQLGDLRTVSTWLKGLDGVDAKRIALWGDSFSPPNAADANLRVPRRIDDRPSDVEPLGATLALLGALYEDGIAAVYIHKGLAEFRGALDSPFVYVPLDAVVPGLLARGDLPDVAAALAPMPLRLSGTVDAGNRALKAEEVRKVFDPAVASYKQAKAELALVISDEGDAAAWLTQQLKP
jgi:hypothetical protein